MQVNDFIPFLTLHPQVTFVTEVSRYENDKGQKFLNMDVQSVGFNGRIALTPEQFEQYRDTPPMSQAAITLYQEETKYGNRYKLRTFKAASSPVAAQVPERKAS